MGWSTHCIPDRTSISMWLKVSQSLSCLGASISLCSAPPPPPPQNKKNSPYLQIHFRQLSKYYFLKRSVMPAWMHLWCLYWGPLCSFLRGPFRLQGAFYAFMVAVWACACSHDAGEVWHAGCSSWLHKKRLCIHVSFRAWIETINKHRFPGEVIFFF